MQYVLSESTTARLKEVLSLYKGTRFGYGGKSSSSRNVTHVRITTELSGGESWIGIPAAYISEDDSWEDYEDSLVIDANGHTLEVDKTYLAIQAADLDDVAVFVTDVADSLKVTGKDTEDEDVTVDPVKEIHFIGATLEEELDEADQPTGKVTVTVPSLTVEGKDTEDADISVVPVTDITFVGATIEDDEDGAITVTVPSLTVSDEDTDVVPVTDITFVGATVTDNTDGAITVTIGTADVTYVGDVTYNTTSTIILNAPTVNVTATTTIGVGVGVVLNFTGDVNINGRPARGSPLTNKGDIWAHNGTTDVAQTVGADGFLLGGDETAANGLTYWDVAPATGVTVVKDNPEIVVGLDITPHDGPSISFVSDVYLDDSDNLVKTIDTYTFILNPAGFFIGIEHTDSEDSLVGNVYDEVGSGGLFGNGSAPVSRIIGGSVGYIPTGGLYGNGAAVDSVTGGGGADLTVGNMAHWRMDELGGTAFDATGNGNHLSEVNTVDTDTGVINGCRTFDGVSSGLSRSSNSGLQTGGKAFSVAGWVYFNSISGNQRIVCKSGGLGDSQSEWELRLDNTPQLSWAAGTTASTTVASSTSISTGTWYFVACRYDLTKIGISVNGGAFTEVTAADTTSHGIAVTLGYLNITGLGPFAYLNGKLDSWSYWVDYALTSSDATALYNGGAGLDYPF